MRKYVVDGGTAVLTGAASGIGRATALELARRGSSLVLLDRDADGLEAVAEEARRARPDRSVTTHVVDLSDGDAALAAAEEVRVAHPHVHLLVNNAGVALAGRFDQVSMSDVDWLLSINLRAVLLMTHTLLPSLLSTYGSHVCNLSSVFGLAGPPGQAAYVTSKFGVRGFGDSLRQELAPYGVGVTTVHPGGIATNIAVSQRQGRGVTDDEMSRGLDTARRLLVLDPAVAARKIVDSVERRKPRVLIGREAYLLDAMARIAPGSYGVLLRAFNDRMDAR
jgi:short-subunit dehydrogenase